SRKEDREKCLAAGMDDFLAKPVRPADLSATIERVLERSPGRTPRPNLVDASVLLASCGGDPVLLQKMAHSLQGRLPENLGAIRDALRDQDAGRLREAAHKCCGLLSEFSTIAGDLAGEVEDLAANGRLNDVTPIVERLETVAQDLVRQVDGISVDTL